MAKVTECVVPAMVVEAADDSAVSHLSGSDSATKHAIHSCMTCQLKPSFHVATAIMNHYTLVNIMYVVSVSYTTPQRRIIDRSMIGMPTNFQHTAHIGSNDFTDPSNNNAMEGVQTQMQTKGGYSGQLPPLAHLKLIDVQPHNMQAVSS